MKTILHALSSYTVRAIDAELGGLKDLYFDATTWDVRYLAVDTHKWLSGRKVLLSPEAIENTKPGPKAVVLKLARKDVERAPPLEEHLPITRQHQTALNHYYGWTPYWLIGSSLEFSMPMPTYMTVTEGLDLPPSEGETFQPSHTVDPNLQSAHDTQGYHIQALGTPIGRVSDWIVDCQTWNIPFFLVEIGSWMEKRRVLLPTSLISAIEWRGKIIETATPPQLIIDAPELEAPFGIDPDTERTTLLHFAGNTTVFSKVQTAPSVDQGPTIYGP